MMVYELDEIERAALGVESVSPARAWWASLTQAERDALIMQAWPLLKECSTTEKENQMNTIIKEQLKQPKPQIMVIECGDCGKVLASHREDEPRPEVSHTCARQVRRNQRGGQG